MLHVGVQELKGRLSEFIRRAADGETIVVTARGRPVAELVPHRSTELPSRLAELVRQGEVTLATKPPLLPKPRARMEQGSSLSQILADERRHEGLFR